MAARENRKQKLWQMKFGDHTRAEYFLTPRNADACLKPLQLERNAVKTLTEMLHEAVSEAGDVAGSGSDGDVEVRFERGECLRFLAGEASKVEKLLSSTLRRSARFSQSATSASVQIEVEPPKTGNHDAAEKGVTESCDSLGTVQRVGKGTLSDPQCLSDSAVSPSSQIKTSKKTKGKNKKRGDSCRNRRWQDSWAVAFPWAVKHREEGEFVMAVQCLVCTKIEGRLRTLCCKRDNLNKHASWCKADKDMPQIGVKKGEQWRDNNNKYYKNEKLFAALNKATVLENLNLPVEMS